MIIHKAYKFRLYPTKEQQILIGKTIGCSRFVFNHFLSEWNQCYEDTQQGLSYGACSASLTALKGNRHAVAAGSGQHRAAVILAESQRFLQSLFQKRSSALQEQTESHSVLHQTDQWEHRRRGKQLKLPNWGLVRCKSKEVDGRILNATAKTEPIGQVLHLILNSKRGSGAAQDGFRLRYRCRLEGFCRHFLMKPSTRTCDLSANSGGNLPRSKKCFPDGEGKQKGWAQTVRIEKLPEATRQGRRNPRANQQCQNRLPAENIDRNRQKPRHHRHRGSAGFQSGQES